MTYERINSDQSKYIYQINQQIQTIFTLPSEYQGVSESYLYPPETILQLPLSEEGSGMKELFSSVVTATDNGISKNYLNLLLLPHIRQRLCVYNYASAIKTEEGLEDFASMLQLVTHLDVKKKFYSDNQTANMGWQESVMRRNLQNTFAFLPKIDFFHLLSTTEEEMPLPYNLDMTTQIQQILAIVKGAKYLDFRLQVTLKKPLSLAITNHFFNALASQNMNPRFYLEQHILPLLSLAKEADIPLEQTTPEMASDEYIQQRKIGKKYKEFLANHNLDFYRIKQGKPFDETVLLKGIEQLSRFVIFAGMNTIDNLLNNSFVAGNEFPLEFTEFIQTLQKLPSLSLQEAAKQEFRKALSFWELTEGKFMGQYFEKRTNKKFQNYFREILDKDTQDLLLASSFLALSKEEIQKIHNYQLLAYRNYEKKIRNSQHYFPQLIPFSEQTPLLLPDHVSQLSQNWELQTIDEILSFFKEEERYANLFLFNPANRGLLKKKDTPTLKKLHISLLEGEMLVQAGVSLENLIQTNDYRSLFQYLCKFVPDWQDVDGIQKPFIEGSNLFGAKRIFQYIDKPSVSRHDALLTLTSLHRIYSSQSTVNPEQFYTNILHQVRMDDTRYHDGSSYHHFYKISRNIFLSNTEIQSLAAKYEEEGNEVSPFFRQYNSPEGVFASWHDFKRYTEMILLIKNQQIINELPRLANTNPALYKYITTLAFHPHSRINSAPIMELWKNPKRFLSHEASHTPKSVQKALEPANYTTVTNLDLSPEELIQALVEGHLDAIQAFPPLEVEYVMHVDTESKSLRRLIHEGLGSQKHGIKGNAKNPSKLYQRLKVFFQEQETSLNEYLQKTDFSKDSFDENETLLACLYNEDFGIKKAPSNTYTVLAKVALKSDPEATVAGDDTVNCMPFGDGKTTVYTFNPNTAQFMIQLKQGDTLRTIAQSVLTRDISVEFSQNNFAISEGLIKEIKLADIISETVLEESSSYISCDNVEVHPNYKDAKWIRLIEATYRQFFTEYMSQFAQICNFNSEKIIIGIKANDALTYLPKIPNTFLPRAPISYTDKIGTEVSYLDLHSKNLHTKIEKQTVHIQPSLLPKKEMHEQIGVKQLTYGDVLSVAYLEEIIYRDNPALLEHLPTLENALIAKDIANQAKGRRNLSFKYINTEGFMKGYLLAYEGRLQDKDLVLSSSTSTKDPIIYIKDFAVDKSASMGAGRLLLKFIDMYKQGYLEKGNLIPICMIARETTSYRLLKRQLNTIGQQLGIMFETEELEKQMIGHDIMHPVIIRPLYLNNLSQ